MLTIGGTVTVGNTCVRVPATTGCMTAGICCLTDVWQSPVCSDDLSGSVEFAAIPSALCWGCVHGTGLVIDTICCTGRGECKAGVHVITADTGTATEEREARAGPTGVGRATADGLSKTDEGDGGAENLDKEEVSANELVDAPEASTELQVVITGETRAAVLPNLDWAESRVGAPTKGDVR